MKKKYAVIVFLVTALLLLGNQASYATILTYDFTLEFSGATAPEGPAPWLTATVDDESDPGYVKLTLDSSGLVDNEWVDKWYFNLNPSLSASSVAYPGALGTTFTTDTSDANWGIFGHSNDTWQADGDSGGLYDFYFDFVNSGDGRFTANETFSVIFNYSGLTAYDFDFGNTGSTKGGPFIMAAHVGGIGPNDDFSGWIAAQGTSTSVPEPATMLLLGTGLLALAGISRRELKK